MNTMQPARIASHTWGRGSDHEQDGALIYIGRRDIFIPHDEIPDAVSRLQAIHAAQD